MTQAVPKPCSCKMLQRHLYLHGSQSSCPPLLPLPAHLKNCSGRFLLPPPPICLSTQSTGSSMAAARLLKHVADVSPRPLSFHASRAHALATPSRQLLLCANLCCRGPAQHIYLMQQLLQTHTCTHTFHCKMWTVSHAVVCGRSSAAAFQQFGGGYASLAVI